MRTALSLERAGEETASGSPQPSSVLRTSLLTAHSRVTSRLRRVEGPAVRTDCLAKFFASCSCDGGLCALLGPIGCDQWLPYLSALPLPVSASCSRAANRSDPFAGHSDRRSSRSLSLCLCRRALSLSPYVPLLALCILVLFLLPGCSPFGSSSVTSGCCPVCSLVFSFLLFLFLVLPCLVCTPLDHNSGGKDRRQGPTGC
jgi:hypothetical protein